MRAVLLWLIPTLLLFAVGLWIHGCGGGPAPKAPVIGDVSGIKNEIALLKPIITAASAEVAAMRADIGLSAKLEVLANMALRLEATMLRVSNELSAGRDINSTTMVLGLVGLLVGIPAVSKGMNVILAQSETYRKWTKQ